MKYGEYAYFVTPVDHQGNEPGLRNLAYTSSQVRADHQLGAFWAFHTGPAYQKRFKGPEWAAICVRLSKGKDMEPEEYWMFSLDGRAMTADEFPAPKGVR